MTTRSGQGVECPTGLRLAAAGLLAPGLIAASDRVPRLRPARVPRFAVDLPIPRVLRPDAEIGVDRYVVHCRNLVHAGHSMMSQLEVVTAWEG